MRGIRILVILIFLLAIVLGGVLWYFQTTPIRDGGEKIVYLRTGWDYDSLKGELESSGLKYPGLFDKLARRMNLQDHIYPGKYKLTGEENIVELIRLFRGARQEQVTVRLSSDMQWNDVWNTIDSVLEVDRIMLKDAYLSNSEVAELGLTGEKRLCLFLADSYYFLWSESAQKVVARFVREYENFWNVERKAKATELGLSPTDVVILASIVDGEAIFDSEMERIAGVYLNRLRRNWPLQADPTILYIIKDKLRRRILLKDLEIDSPYNTYKNLGLPPGPIGLPSKKAIDAVLNAEDHSYMFFVARADLSGYHDFSKTHAEHTRKANLYRRALDERKIRE